MKNAEENFQLVEGFLVSDAKTVIRSLENDLPDNFIEWDSSDEALMPVTYDAENKCVVFHPLKKSETSFNIPRGREVRVKDGETSFFYRRQHYRITSPE